MQPNLRWQDALRLERERADKADSLSAVLITCVMYMTIAVGYAYWGML